MRVQELARDLERARHDALEAPHVAALDCYRTALAAIYGDVPHVDPFDGGAAASCLMLLETPGPRAGAIRFVSRDNPTATARNIRRFCEAAGLERCRMVLWNAVPWVIHAAGERNRVPNRGEIARGLALLPGLLDHLPDLRVVVLAGRIAGLADATVRAAKPGVSILQIPHPSPVYVNTAPDIAPGIVATLQTAARLLASA